MNTYNVLGYWVCTDCFNGILGEWDQIEDSKTKENVRKSLQSDKNICDWYSLERFNEFSKESCDCCETFIAGNRHEVAATFIGKGKTIDLDESGISWDKKGNIFTVNNGRYSTNFTIQDVKLGSFKTSNSDSTYSSQEDFANCLRREIFVYDEEKAYEISQEFFEKFDVQLWNIELLQYDEDGYLETREMDQYEEEVLDFKNTIGGFINILNRIWGGRYEESHGFIYSKGEFRSVIVAKLV